MTSETGNAAINQDWDFERARGRYWVNDPAYGAPLDGSSDDSVGINAAIVAANAAGGGDVILPKAAKIDSDVSLLSNVALVGVGGKRVEVTGAGDIKAVGTAAGNSSNISAAVEHGDYKIDVVDGSGFSANDNIEFLASPDEAANSSTMQQRELCKIESIVKKVTNQPTNVTGVVVDYASSGSASGNGTLSYTNSTTSLTWAENGDSAGSAVDVSGEGDTGYTLSSSNGETILVYVTVASLPGSDQSDTDITVDTSANTLVLSWPVGHAYPISDSGGAFATPPKITVVDSLVSNIKVLNLDLAGTSNVLYFVYVDTVEADVKISGGGTYGNVSVTEGSVRNAKLNIKVEDELSRNNGPNALIYLWNHSKFEAKLDCYGGELDHLRLYGCSHGVLNNPQFIESVSRPMFGYQCSHITIHDPVVKGSRSLTGNVEQYLFKDSYKCTIYNPYYDEPNKQGGTTGVDVFEFGNRNKHLKIIGGHVKLYNNNLAIYKLDCGGDNVFRDLTVDLMTDHDGNYFLFQPQSGGATPDKTSVLIDNITVNDYSPSGVGCHLVRTSSSTSVTDNNVELFVIQNCDVPLEGNIGVTLPGTGSLGINTFIVRNNNWRNVTGTARLVNLNGLPITGKVFIHDNTLDASGRSIWSDRTCEIHCHNNDGITYTLSNATRTILDNLGIESAAANTPTAASWQPGQMVEFTDTVDASGDGIYILNHDGSTWSQIA